jgi:ABC-type multidrug transport system ATPase subunit
MCDAGTTILVTTHLTDEAERCHHIAVINEGKKVADGTPEELKSALNAATLEISDPHIPAIKERVDSLPPVWDPGCRYWVDFHFNRVKSRETAHSTNRLPRGCAITRKGVPPFPSFRGCSVSF